MTDTDTRYMKLALALAARGLGRVWPWPSVGCVIVNDGRIVGRGTSDRETMRHAERVALDQAGEQARGATAYVTLEPCSHHGNTPPCADALIEAGVARVVVATGDPNELVNGQGIARLQDAGIDVVTGLCEKEARAQNAGFFKNIVSKRPHVTLKLAASLDGRIATASGESKWITGPEARRRVHLMRARHDAVLIGGGTARADDPSLDVRGLGKVPQPVRIVVSRHLDIPLTGKLALTAKAQPLWFVHGVDAEPGRVDAWKGLGAKLICCRRGRGRDLDLQGAFEALASEGLTRILCEGGGDMAASLLGEGLVDEVVMFHAGLMIGAEGRPMLGALGLERLGNAQRFALVEDAQVGNDAMSRWVLRSE